MLQITIHYKRKNTPLVINANTAIDLLKEWNKVTTYVRGNVDTVHLNLGCTDSINCFNVSDVIVHLNRAVKLEERNIYRLAQYDSNGIELYSVSGELASIKEQFDMKYKEFAIHPKLDLHLKTVDGLKVAMGLYSIGNWIHDALGIPYSVPEDNPVQVHESPKTVQIDVESLFSEINTLLEDAPNAPRIRKLLTVLNYVLTK